MSKVIVVSSNCTTGGTAAALQQLFPDAAVIPLPLLLATDEELADNVSRADIWVCDDPGDRIDRVRVSAPQAQLVKIPRILFSAFHPDLVYASRVSEKCIINPHYNSAIAIWCYRNCIEPEDAASLFSRNVFAQLGYLSRWTFSVALLERYFSESCLDFNRYMCAIQRYGVFMYSINHPKIAVLVLLAKMIARALGKDEGVFDRELYIRDALLESDHWPVYPEIGYELSMPASYEWRFADRNISGLRAYLDFVFENYRSQGIPPDDITILPHPAYPLTMDFCDQVLGRYLGGR